MLTPSCKSFLLLHAEQPSGRHTTVLFREPDRGPKRFSTKVADYDNNAHLDDFDTEDACPQVLAEAQSHVADGEAMPTRNSPARHPSIQSWLARSPDMRHQSNTSSEDEVFARHKGETIRTPMQKALKSWKKLLFWKRSKKNNQFEFQQDGGATIQRTFTTPLHHLFKSSRTRETVAPSTASMVANRNFTSSMPKRSLSCPIYYDGTPYSPNRTIRPLASPLSAYAIPSRDGLHEAIYTPLPRPYSQFRSCPSPLYVP